MRNLTIEKVKNELRKDSVERSKGGESSKSLLSDVNLTNRSSKGNLFELLDDSIKEKLKSLIPQQLAHRQSISFARVKPHMFDKEEITDQNIYNPIELINSPRKLEKVEDNNAKSRFYKQDTKNSKNPVNSPGKSKNRLKSSQTVQSSKTSTDGSYTENENYLEESMDESHESFDRSSFDMGDQ